MRKVLRKVTGDRWVEAEVTLENGRLSVTGSEGRILSENDAAEEALEYWRSFFEDYPEEVGGMFQRFPQGMADAIAEHPGGVNVAAAHFVVDTDGAHHGLDVHATVDGDVWIVESCGCIHETLAETFPELRPLIPWHLNDMNAGCEHQQALGWGRGHDVALDAETMTGAQRSALEERNRKLDANGGAPEPVRSEVFSDSIGAPCPECGYCYGTAWLNRDLPPEAQQAFASLGDAA